MDPSRWRRPNVLAVDDQPANLVAVDAVLSSNFNVIRAHSGEEALSIVASRDDIDVALVDVQMPGMDGFELASKMKKVAGYDDIPIVFITAIYHEDPFVKQGYQVGAVDYFSKPFDPEILRIKVGIYASFRQKTDLLREFERQARASEDLRRAGRQVSDMLDHMTMGVIVTDTAGHIRFFNAEQVDPRTLDWWDDDGRLREGRSASLAHVLANGKSKDEACEVRGAEGSPRSMLCTVSPLHAPGGALSGAVVIVRDVTERDRLELNLQQRMADSFRAAGYPGSAP